MGVEIELVIIGEVTDNVKRTLFESFNTIRSKGFRRVNLRVFVRSAPLRYLEVLRDVLLANMVTSVRLYEHDLNEVHSSLEQLVREGKEVVVISDEEPLRSQALSVIGSSRRSTSSSEG